ncbi:MAG: hypothetical protein GF418_01635 [Chitinivibrionales bacterium]|nr:hypothetical protein [Chitinivibrionales bacterium]
MVHHALVADVSDHGMKVVALDPMPSLQGSADEDILFTAWTPKGFSSFSGRIRWIDFQPHGASVGVKIT